VVGLGKILVCICWVYGGLGMSGVGLWRFLDRFLGGLGQGLGDFRLIRGRSRLDFGMYMLGLWGF
jgi:hypothetical protein